MAQFCVKFWSSHSLFYIDLKATLLDNKTFVDKTENQIHKSIVLWGYAMAMKSDLPATVAGLWLHIEASLSQMTDLQYWLTLMRTFAESCLLKFSRLVKFLENYFWRWGRKLRVFANLGEYSEHTLNNIILWSRLFWSIQHILIKLWVFHFALYPKPKTQEMKTSEFSLRPFDQTSRFSSPSFQFGVKPKNETSELEKLRVWSKCVILINTTLIKVSDYLERILVTSLWTGLKSEILDLGKVSLFR